MRKAKLEAKLKAVGFGGSAHARALAAALRRAEVELKFKETGLECYKLMLRVLRLSDELAIAELQLSRVDSAVGDFGAELGLAPEGQCEVVLSTGARRKRYLSLLGPKPKGAEVCHRCDEPLCAVHVFYGSRSDNIVDAAVRAGKLDQLRVRRTLARDALRARLASAQLLTLEATLEAI